MAISMAEFVEKTQCEVVADQMIHGIGPTRRMIGYVKDGTFTITDEGTALLAELEAKPAEEVAAPKRRRKAENVEPEDKPEESSIEV